MNQNVYNNFSADLFDRLSSKTARYCYTQAHCNECKAHKECTAYLMSDDIHTMNALHEFCDKIKEIEGGDENDNCC